MRLFLFLVLIWWVDANAQAAVTDTNLGQLIVTEFASAPFPHPLRTQGHQYKDKFFSTEEHYQDSHVALFVPKGFRARGKIDFVVHFHGWNNSLTNVLVKYQLLDQFANSERNAILIVPQGPLNSPDSFDGKLEEVDGFRRFMDEAVGVLRQRGIIKSSRIGRIILSGHSGGYEAISSIVAWGGLSDHVREVWLFDALYANTERFVLWFDRHKSRFVDIYTDHGGTKEETLNLMAALKGNQVPYFADAETNAVNRELSDSHLVFLYSELPHDETMQRRQTFQRLLETSSLDAIKR